MKSRNMLLVIMLISPCLIFSNCRNQKENSTDKLGGKNFPVIEKADSAWSVSMADVVLHVYPKYIAYDTANVKWDYEVGVVLNGIWQVWEKTGDQKYYDYVKNNIDYFLPGNGTIKTYDLAKFRLDDICTGRIVLDLYEKTKDVKYKKAAELLRKQLSQQPRTPEGGFWHKEIYPQQMWLDGLYMAEPFYAQYAKIFNEPKDFDDITKQFILMAKHAKDPETGLFYHGWDYSKKQKWADPKTGDSPSFWGRAMGWYLIGLVDVLDYLPKDNPKRHELISIFKNLCASLLKFQNNKTHLWYLILDKPDEKGNYFESSASAMFMYAYAKGANSGYLDKKFLDNAKQIFEGLVNNSIKIGKDGYPHLYNTIKGAGLGGNPYRSGSFQYYANEPTRVDDFKGLGPFITGCLQLEKDHLIK